MVLGDRLRVWLRCTHRVMQPFDSMPANSKKELAGKTIGRLVATPTTIEYI